MDILGIILDRIEALQADRDVHEKAIAAIVAKEGKLERMYEMAEDPDTAELMREALLGVAVQAGAEPGQLRAGEPAAHVLGMQRVREYVARMRPGQDFTVHDIYMMSIEHRPSGDAHLRAPEFQEQRKRHIAMALNSMAKGKDLEVVKPARGRDHGLYRRPAISAVA